MTIEQLGNCVLNMLCEECNTELDNFDNDCECVCHSLV